MIQNKYAFTLIELLVVVLIIGILAAVALPQYQKAVEKSRATNVYTLLSAMYSAQKTFYLANGYFTRNLQELDIDFPYDDGGEDVSEFEGGTYTWRKCNEGTCMSARKTYKDSIYGLQVYFEEQDVQEKGKLICFANTVGQGVDICKALGYNTPYHVGTFASKVGEVTYYKQP